MTLKRDALQQKITRESYGEFQARVIRTILGVSVEIIDKLIGSMRKRIENVIENRL